jgi:hypothetical protein
MTNGNSIKRRTFLQASVAASAGASTAADGLADNSIVENGMPYGMIGDIKISRLILGSNVMGGGAHSRDLVYVRKLMSLYNTQDRLLNVLKTAEAQGINTILQGNANLVNNYNAEFDGHMQQIRPLKMTQDDTTETIQQKFDEFLKQSGPLVYVMGDTGDQMTRDGRVDIIAKALDIAKKSGVVCGVGGHSLGVVKACEEQELKPAFYVKTFHHDQYWSATPKGNRKDFCWYDDKGGNSYSGVQLDHGEFHDNIWCLDPEETIEVMQKVSVPWLAFKVLAAGAISPTSGFKYALQNGADFMAVGMLDFQIEEDAAIFKGMYARGIKRQRPWRA